MDLSQIGKPGTILSIFLPGLFVLANLLIFIHYVNENLLSELSKLIDDNVFSAFMLLSFSYLIGIVLRLIKTEGADNCSRLYLSYISHKYRSLKNEVYLQDKFPYIEWIGVVCTENYPSSALHFYDQVWSWRYKREGNREFFNLCKIILLTLNSDLAARCYALENENRSISGMFYGLVSSGLLLLYPIFTCFYDTNILSVVPLILLSIFYSIGILYILKNFHFIRLKEALEVFNCTYSVRKDFIQMLCLYSDET